MNKTEKMIGAGAGVAVLTALGTYLLYGERGEKNRRAISGWMLKLKGEVMEKAEEITDLNKEEYYNIVDEVSARYAKLGKVGAGELKHLTSELKNAWGRLNKEMQ